MNPQPSNPFAIPTAPVVMWASSDGTLCLLTCDRGAIDLRIEYDGAVLRQARYLDYRQACEASRQWRVDWDMESRRRKRRSGRITCPECGGDVLPERDSASGAEWLRCASCGDAWGINDAPVREMWRLTH
jgi:hypothetical protein